MIYEMERKPRIAFLYHYMAPDDVVSAQHMSGLAEDLVLKGWDVEALPCRRGCRDERKVYSAKETLRGVRYSRIWRPPFPQASFLGRLMNAAWMIVAWSALGLRSDQARPDVILIGTDPIFAALSAIPIRFFAPNVKLVHWCFDMHPEAAVVTRRVRERGFAAKLATAAMKAAYRRFDLIADIGGCMRNRLYKYGHQAKEIELTPWALEEPHQVEEPDDQVRYEMFGAASIGILYSGNFGEAHTYEEILKLARGLRGHREIQFCLAVRGNQAKSFRNAVTPDDINIRFVDFAPPDQLKKRLGAADIHLVTLKSNWEGVAVPSKFFGSLAIGRPCLYFGPRDSAIARWINQYGVGWHGDFKDIEDAAAAMRSLVKDRSIICTMRERAHRVYHEQFSRKTITEKWHEELRRLIESPQKSPDLVMPK